MAHALPQYVPGPASRVFNQPDHQRTYSPILYPSSQGSPQTQHFLGQYYAAPPQSQAGFTHLAHSYPERIKHERRRPKYTRSKNGCLTCRKKKVKCDEAKPKCTRCMNSAGECLWPPMTVKKKSQPRRKTSSGDLDSSADRASFSSTPSNDHDVSNPNIINAGFEANGHQHISPHLPEQSVEGTASGDVDGRGSTPHLQIPIPNRRHSTGDVLNSQLEQHLGGGEGGALGLTQVPQLNASARMAADFVHPQSAPHLFQHYPTANYPTANSAHLFAHGGSPYGPARPSTAGSIPLSHSLARRASSSRPSTAGSLPTSHFIHRPPSSSSGSVSGDGYPANMVFAMNGQHHRHRGSLDMSHSSTPASIASFSSSSRPSTAGSAAPSPFMRNVMHLGPDGPNGERWLPPNPSPLMHSVALSQQQMYNSESVYAASMHSTPQHSRPHTPWN